MRTQSRKIGTPNTYTEGEGWLGWLDWMDWFIVFNANFNNFSVISWVRTHNFSGDRHLLHR